MAERAPTARRREDAAVKMVADRSRPPWPEVLPLVAVMVAAAAAAMVAAAAAAMVATAQRRGSIGDFRQTAGWWS